MAYGKSRLTNPEVHRLELAAPSPEAHAMLLHAQRQLQRVANHCVRRWLLWHDEAQTLFKMSQGLPTMACPPPLCATWLRESQALCPDVHSATVLAVTNWLAQTYTRQTSPRANEKRWRRVLRGDESHWSYQNPLPIRLWNGNAKIVREAGGAAVVVRVDRRPQPGRKLATSTPLVLPLVRPKGSNRTAGHRAAYAAACEIADGVRPLSQSQLCWDARLRKWFLFLTASGAAPAEHAARDATRVLVIRPGRHAALRVHADGIAGDFGEEALDRVSRVRRRLDERRDGADARLREHLAATWRRQSGAICDALAAEVVRSLASRDFGRLLWLDGDNRTAALALAGRKRESDRRELFPFELLRRKIEKRLGELGIEVVGRANFRSVKRRIAERRKRLAAHAV